MMFPKSPSIKNLKWRRAVVDLGACVTCGKHGVQAAHLNQGKGMGMKTSDHLTAALCPDCHWKIDNGPFMTLEQRRAEMDRAIVQTFDRLVRSGVVGLV